MQCSICKEITSGVLWRKPGLSVVRCRQCGFLAADLDEWQYPYTDHDYYTKIDPIEVNPGRPYIQHRVSQIRRFIKEGRVIDLGCGLGETAIALRCAGFEAHGVEESKNAITFLRKDYPEIQWYNSRIEHFLNKSRLAFDVITLFHVLEHIPSPQIVSQKISTALRPNGLLVIEVPDVSGGQAWLRGKHWQHWIPHHVNYFSLATLHRLLLPLGLRYVGMETKYHLGFPQGIIWRDAIHGTLAYLRLHDIITTYWRKIE